MRRRDLLTTLACAPLLGAAARAGAASPSTPRLLTAAPATAAAAGETALPVWAYDGLTPGPVLRFRRRDVLDIELLNRLPDPTTIHWHGIRLPNAMDGVPHLTQAPVAPGERFRYRFGLPDAGTFWYHPHLGTPEQVERGLAGALIVEDDAPPPVDEDRVVVLDDWRLDAQGRVSEDFYRFHDVAHAGRLGQRLTANGAVAPEWPVRTGQRWRLRLINAANARIFGLEIPTGLRGWLIARDGVPASQAVPWEGQLLLGPGMRADLIIDLDAPGRFALTDTNGREPVALGHFVVDGASNRRAKPVPRPAAFEPLPEPDLTQALEHTIAIGGGARSRQGWPDDPPEAREARRQRRAAGAREADPAWTLNGKAHVGDHAHHHAPEFRVARGRSVRLRLDNATAWWHPMHLHGHHFRVLARNGTPVPDAPWRDTVLMAPGDRLDIAFVADNPGRWMLHCHVLEHHAGGMGTVFEVEG